MNQKLKPGDMVRFRNDDWVVVANRAGHATIVLANYHHGIIHEKVKVSHLDLATKQETLDVQYRRA